MSPGTLGIVCKPHDVNTMGAQSHSKAFVGFRHTNHCHRASNVLTSLTGWIVGE